MDYCDFTKLEGGRQGLKKLLATTDENGQKVLTLGKNCEPKPFQQSIQVVSNKTLADFWKDLVVAFDYYLQIKYDKTVNVSVNQIENGFSIDIEFAEEDLHNDFQKYEKEFQDFLEDPMSQLQEFSGSDKVKLVGKFSSIFISKVFLLKYYLETDIIKENEATGLLEPIKKLIKTPKLFNLNFMLNLFSNNKNNGNLALPNGNDNTTNQNQTNPTTDQILIILNKILEYKPKNKEEKKVFENINDAKKEIENGNIEEAKKILSLNKVWNFISDSTNQIALGLTTNYVFEIIKPFIGLK